MTRASLCAAAVIAFGAPNLAPHPAEVMPEVGLAAIEGLRSHAECRGRSVLDLTCFDRQYFSTADPVIRTESQPGRERRRVGEPREIRTDLPQESLRRERVHPWNFCQVHSEDPIEMTLEIEGGPATACFLSIL